MTGTVRAQPSLAVRSAVGLIGVGALIGLAAMSIHRAGHIRYDFDHFYLDARYVIEHGGINTDDQNPDRKLRGRLRNYLPIATLLFVPFAALGSWCGGAMWVLINVVLFVALVRHVGRHLADRPGGDGCFGQALPVVLCGGVIYEHFRFNQASIVVLAILLGAYVLLERGRDVAAGVAVALATIIKLMPAVFMLYLVLRRRWRATVAAMVAVVVLDVGGSLLAFGPADTLRYHRRWWYFVRQDSGLALMSPAPGSLVHEHFLDHRNQSLAIVLAKALPGHLPMAKGLYLGAMGASVLAVLVWVCRGLGEGVWPRRLTFAAWLLLMLWFTPLLRQYYLIWAYPAVAVLVERVRHHRLAGRPAGMSLSALVVWIVSMLLWMIDAWTGHVFRAAGVNLWAVVFLLAALLVESHREGRMISQADGASGLGVRVRGGTASAPPQG